MFCVTSRGCGFGGDTSGPVVGNARVNSTLVAGCQFLGLLPWSHGESVVVGLCVDIPRAVTLAVYTLEEQKSRFLVCETGNS